MREEVVRVSVDFTVNEGQREEFRNVAAAMTAGAGAEPGTLGYEWFWSAEGNRIRLLETYANADAIRAHFSGPVVSELVPKLLPFCRIDRFEVYGDPGAKVAEMARGLGAEIFAYGSGLSR